MADRRPRRGLRAKPSMTAVRVLALLALLLSVFSGPTGSAQDRCPAAPGASAALAERDATERLAFIRATLAAERARVRSWSTGWSVGLGVLAGGQAALVAVLPAEWDMRPDLLVGAASSAIGVGSLLILPLDILADQPAFEASIASASERDLCALVAEAERILERDAENEADGAGWLMHAANAALAVGSGLLLGFVWDHWQGAGVQIGASLAIGEAMLWTQPTGLPAARQRYRAGALGPDDDLQLGIAFGVAPLLTPQGGGLQILARF